jgi:transposase
VALAAIRGENTLAELAQHFDVLPTSFRKALPGSSGLRRSTAANPPPVDVKFLHAKIAGRCERPWKR